MSRSPINAIYCCNLSREGTLHMHHKKVGDQMVQVVLVVVAVQHPRLVGLGCQMFQIQSRQKQAVVPNSEPERLEGWRWEIWSPDLKRIWHPDKPVEKINGILVIFFNIVGNVYSKHQVGRVPFFLFDPFVAHPLSLLTQNIISNWRLHLLCTEDVIYFCLFRSFLIEIEWHIWNKSWVIAPEV